MRQIMKTLHPTKLRQSADYLRTQHHVRVDPDVTIEDVTTPGFWAHHVERIRVDDLIDVVGETFDMQLRATGKGVGFVEMRVLRKWVDKDPVTKLSPDEIAAIEATIPAGYTIDHTPKTGWRARLEDGGAEVSRNHKTKVEAIKAAVAHAARTQGIAA
jgi:hypothetical protein